MKLTEGLKRIVRYSGVTARLSEARTTGQRACIGVDLLPACRVGARDRMMAGGVEDFEEYGQARDIAGKIVGVSGRYVRRAEHLRLFFPELFAAVAAGDRTLNSAWREAAGKGPERDQAPERGPSES